MSELEPSASVPTPVPDGTPVPPAPVPGDHARSAPAVASADLLEIGVKWLLKRKHARSLDDAEQIALVAYEETWQKHDPARGASFKTFLFKLLPLRALDFYHLPDVKEVSLDQGSVGHFDSVTDDGVTEGDLNYDRPGSWSQPRNLVTSPMHGQRAHSEVLEFDSHGEPSFGARPVSHDQMRDEPDLEVESVFRTPGHHPGDPVPSACWMKILCIPLLAEDAVASTLTDVQRERLTMFAQGMSINEIARDQGVSVRAVRLSLRAAGV
jgi:DNA-directed RNA polymerase specialized sigma24 family protein